MGEELESIEKRYGHLVVVVICLLTVAVVTVTAIYSHWFNQRLLSDFWPIDKASVAPNILASFVIFDLATLAAALFYPPFKKALDRGFTRHKDDIKAHVNEGLKAIREDAQRHHDERIAQYLEHHEAATALAKEHHAKQLRAIRESRTPKVKP